MNKALKPNHRITMLFLFIATLHFFQYPINKIISWAVVVPAFSFFPRGFCSDILIVVVAVLFVRWMVCELSQTILLNVFLLSFIFFAFQRFNYTWAFIYMQSLPKVAYWDVIIFSLGMALVLSYVLKEINEIEPELFNGGFIHETAVTSFEGDGFRRKETAREIARTIVLTKKSKGFAIGVLGEYGSGKTSFLNLINLNLNKTDVLHISFNPWSAGNPSTIRREFFDLMATEVSILDRRASSLIYSYGRNLSSVDERSDIWLNWFDLLNDQRSTQSSREYKRINKMLQGVGKKIVITIDDLDRLYPDEIMAVLKLIRNTADFSNVFYLVGYDKAYVQNAIKTINGVGELSFLDKIFQLEIPLPKREEDDLLVMLQKHLRGVISEEHEKNLENVLIPDSFKNPFQNEYRNILRNGRDVIRFVNGLIIIYKLIGHEVDFKCLFLLELIKCRFPLIYDLIYTHSKIFLTENPVMSSYEQYYTPQVAKIEANSEEVTKFKLHIEELQYFSPDDIAMLDGLFKNLFGGTYHRPEGKNSIAYPLYFDIYFRYRLSEKDISDKDFKAAIASKSMPEYLKKCASSNLHNEVMTRLMQENITISKTHFEEVIKWIFSFGNTYVSRFGMFNFGYTNLINRIYYAPDSNLEKLYRKDIEAYKSFITSLFKSASYPFIFENELIYNLKKQELFILTREELTSFQFNYFTQIADSTHGLNSHAIWIFWGSRSNYRLSSDGQEIPTENWQFEPSLVEKMFYYLKNRNPVEFLKSSIDRNIRDDLSATISRKVLEMFTEKDDLKNIIETNTHLDSEVKVEFLKFFDDCANVDFMQYVDIDFKTELNKKLGEV